MSKNKDEVPKLTLTNTKKEMLEAYNQLVDRLTVNADEELRPEKEKEQRRVSEAVVVAEEIAAGKIGDGIAGLKNDITAALADIAARMEGQVSGYRQVKEAIVAKERELSEIFDIERNAYSLAALLEAQKQKREAFDQQMATRREELEREIATGRALWEQQQAEARAKAKEQQEQTEKQRRREQEEYDYGLKRERELKTNALQDETNRLERELAQKKEAFEKKVELKEAELKEREAAVAQQEKRIGTLDLQVEKFPKEMEEGIKRAVKETTEKLTAEAVKNEELLRKTFEGEKNVLATRIEAFERLTVEQKKQLEQLSAQLEKAYGKVQDIAVKAVSSPRERYFADSQTKGADRNDGK